MEISKKASDVGSLNLLAYRDVLRYFSLRETETSVESNLQHACTHHNSLMYQKVAERMLQKWLRFWMLRDRAYSKLKKENQVHRAQVPAPSQMYL